MGLGKNAEDYEFARFPKFTRSLSFCIRPKLASVIIRNWRSVSLEPDLELLIGEVRLISDFIRPGIIQASECPYNAAYSEYSSSPSINSGVSFPPTM